MTHLSGFVLQNNNEKTIYICVAAYYATYTHNCIPSTSGLKRFVHEDAFPHSSVGSFWKYDAGSEQLKAVKYSISHIYGVVSSVFMVLAIKLSQSPVEISFSYARQVCGHSSMVRLVLSLHGGFATKQNVCRARSRQAGGDCVSCAKTFSMKNPGARFMSMITAFSGGSCEGLSYSLPLPNIPRQ